MRKCIFLTLAALLVVMPEVYSRKRSRTEIEKIVTTIFQNSHKSFPRSDGEKTDVSLKSQQVLAGDNYIIFQQSGSDIVIVSTDDRLPEVLGYSQNTSLVNSEDGTVNPGFNWWLKAVDSAAGEIIKANKQYAPIKPNIDMYQERVAPLVTTQWGQEEPYFNMTPIGTTSGPMGEYTQGHCLTGCVATAIAQIMNYYKFPDHGQNYHYVYYPSGDVTGAKLEVDFYESYYDWNNMLDEYRSNYSEIEANAVAKLMYDCGVASNMIYRPTASGALSKDAAEALVKYFGYSSSVSHEHREHYSDEEWMDKIFNELSSGRPIFYGANDVAAGGHAFVIDGYNSNGLVHVNWGWEGKDDGYYDISILNPGTYEFSMNQDAIIGICPDKVTETITENLILNAPGQLSERFNAEEIMRIKKLTISGPLNSSDVRSLRIMAGVDENGGTTAGILKDLDLSSATIVEGGAPYLVPNNYTTVANAISDYMFAGCAALKTLILPESITKMGDGAFVNCDRLETIYIPEGNDKEYIIDGNLIFNSSKSELICCLPTDLTPVYEMPASLTSIHKDAFNGAVKLMNLITPSSLQSIGSNAFENCISLRQIKLFAVTPPILSADAFKDIKKQAVTILVRAGSKSKYEEAEGWKDFKGSYLNDNYPVYFDNIKEFGTTIKVTNAYREYGEANPDKYGYKITGDQLSGGTPVISCDADEFSPVGQYTIHIEAGTITDEAVNYQDGILFVMPATLTAIAEDATRYEGCKNPEFKVKFEGFRNNDDESVIEELPVVTTTADETSPIGDYPLMVSGGSANNYDFQYVNGILHVTKDASVDNVEMPSEKILLYDLLGRKLPTGVKYQRGVYILNGKKVVIK